MERDVAEEILKLILEKGKLGTLTISHTCLKNKVNEIVVYQFLKEYTIKGRNSGFGDEDYLQLKDGSANFVYLGCWSGEEKRKYKENKKNHRIVIISSIISAIIAVAGTLLAQKCKQ